MTKPNEWTKIVVRRLPPYLKEEDFKAELEKVASGTYTWFRFCQGKTSTKRVTYSRAYLNFHEARQVVEFKAKFDGFVFVGARGSQYKCMVEYAPYQRIPKQKSKRDHREGTIDADPDYLEFLEQLDKEPVMLPSAQRQYEEEQAQKLAAGEEGDSVVVTPLMEFVVSKNFKKTSSRASGRDRDGRRREQGRRNYSKSKTKAPRAPPKVLLLKRPPKQSESTEKKSSPARDKEKRSTKMKEGHQAWVPKIMRPGGNRSDASKEKQSSLGEASEPGHSEKVDAESNSNGRGRGRRHRGGKGSSNKSPSTKLVWVPKSEKQGGE